MRSSSRAASSRLASMSKVDPHFADALAQVPQAFAEFAHINRRQSHCLLHHWPARPRPGPSRRAAALLVLFPAAAGAGVVAPHLGLYPPGRPPPLGPWGIAGTVVGGPAQKVGPGLLPGRAVHHDPGAEQRLHRVLL